jgi:GNAT superfamily N-acetyltransferase
LANLRLAHSVLHPAPFAELSDLFVEEAQRRKGIGLTLLRFVEELALRGGARRLIIATDFYNHVAQQLYRSAGYRHYDIVLAKTLEK